MSVTVNASSTSLNPSHHVSLVVGSTTVGLNIKGFPKNFRQYPYSPSSLQFSTGRQGYGSFEPPYTSIDQVDWTGGFGQLRYKDVSKFYDSYNMWSLTDGTLMPAPCWRFAKNMNTTASATPENTHMPGDRMKSAFGLADATDVVWKTLTGTSRYYATQFTTDDTYDPSDLWLFLKYFKHTDASLPGTLNVAIYTDTGSNSPSTLVTNALVALTAANIPKAAPEGDMIGQLICFNFATAPSLSTGTNYWVIVYAADTDGDTTGYWQIAYTDDTGQVYGQEYKDSSAGSSWATSSGPAFYRLHEAIKDARLHFVEYKNGLYACSEPLDGTAGQIYRNGDRGVSTGTSSTSTLEDTTKSWNTSAWKFGGVAHVWNGTGQGQFRKITANDANTLTISPNWDITPVQGGTDVGSEYTIIGSANWHNVTPSGTGAKIPASPITDAMTLWGILYIAMGEKDNLHRVREYNDNGSPGVWTTFWGGNSATAVFGTNVAAEETSNNALFLAVAPDPKNEYFVWYARNENPAEWTGTDQTSVRKADDVTWGTDLSFTYNVVPVGTRDHLITGITMYNGMLFIGKEDGIWYVDFDGTFDRVHPLQVGLSAMSEPTNCRMMFAKDLYLYFNWSNSVERLYGATLQDVGPWQGAGMVERARGPIVDGIPVIGWEFMAVDGGPDGQSSIIASNGRGWHTLFRAPSRVLSAFSGSNANPRIRSLHWQSIPGKDSTNILWWEFGGQIMFMRFPRASLNPSQDSNVDLAPESFVVHSEMDTGYAELEKYFGKGRHVCNNVSGELNLDYDTNANPFSFSWTNAARTDDAPSYSYAIGDSRKRNIFLRTRISTENIDDPSVNNIQALVLDAFARKPVKYNWEMKIDLSDNRNTITGDIDFTQDTIMDQLAEWSGWAQAIAFRCTDSFADDSGSGRTVVVEPPNIFRSVWNKIMRIFKGTATVTLREL